MAILVEVGNSGSLCTAFREVSSFFKYSEAQCGVIKRGATL
jgi:hypothetical protein